MKRILNSAEWVRLPLISFYCHNFFANIQTGEIILEEADDDETYEYYTTRNDNEGRILKDEYIGFCPMEDFQIPTQEQRALGTKESVYEFDSTWS